MSIKKFHDCVTKEFAKVKLDMSFEIVKDTHIKSNVVFVFTMFRLKNPYKDDIIYTAGLIKNIEHIKKYVENSIIRIYYDDSILKKDDSWRDLFKQLCDDKYVQLIKYDFKQFKESTVFHKDLFGTLIRFLPLFNFCKSNEIVILEDIDFDITDPYFYSTYIPKYIKFINDKKTIIFISYKLSIYIEKGRLEISPIIKKYKFVPRVVVSPTISSIQINKNIFVEFIKCMYVKCNDYTTWMKETTSRINCNSPTITEKDKSVCRAMITEKFSKHGLFLFGIDEFFINFYIFNELLDNKKNFYIYTKLPPMGDYNNLLYNFMYKEKSITHGYLENFQKFVLKNEHTNNIKHNYNLINYILNTTYDGKADIVNSDKQKLKLYILYSKRAYDFIRNSLSNGSFKNNLIEKSQKIKNYYMLYFDIIKQIHLKPFAEKKNIFKITYEKNEVLYKPVK
jgi:hypothetical protein